MGSNDRLGRDRLTEWVGNNNFADVYIFVYIIQD